MMKKSFTLHFVVLGGPLAGLDTMVKLPGNSLVTIPTWNSSNLLWCINLASVLNSWSAENYLRSFKELFIDVLKLLPKTEGSVNIHFTFTLQSTSDTIKYRLRLNALGVTLDFYGKSDRGSVWTKMYNVTPYYFVIILY